MVLVNPAAAWSVVCGLGLGVGLWSLVSMMPRLARPRLIHRVAPYLVDVSDGAREMIARRPADPLPVFGSLLAPLLNRMRAMIGPALGSAQTVELRLRQSGSRLTVDALRSRQLVFAICGVAVGVLFSVLQAQSLPGILPLLIVVLCGVGGFVLRDYLLQRAARARMARMSNELPIVLEFLTLSLSAGEGILDSIRRVARIGGGELAKEFSGVITAVNSGSPLAGTLTRLADGIRLPSLSRCIEQVVGALERGTPLSEVLRAQAQDAREESKRELIEVAGKKEVAMMIPLVFLILPITILFAIFPGIFVLQLGF